MTVAASSKIELTVCFENVARNIFGSLDGTMTGPQLAAVLAADTGVGLLPWELKVFLNELDLGDDDVIDSGRFCGIYHFLASRPPTPAVPAAAATKPVAITNPETNPQEEEVVEEVATAETQFVEPVEPVQLPVEPVSAETTTAKKIDNSRPFLNQPHQISVSPRVRVRPDRQGAD